MLVERQWIWKENPALTTRLAYARLKQAAAVEDLDFRDRHGSGATLITSQFPVAAWHETIPDPTVADAILDRLIHNAHRIELKGESMRKRKEKV